METTLETEIDNKFYSVDFEVTEVTRIEDYQEDYNGQIWTYYVYDFKFILAKIWLGYTDTDEEGKEYLESEIDAKDLGIIKNKIDERITDHVEDLYRDEWE